MISVPESPVEHCLPSEKTTLDPGTRYIMSRCPFDHDDITLTSSENATLELLN